MTQNMSMPMPMLHIQNDRHAKLLQLLPKYNWKVAPAAIEAGFTENTAYKCGKSLLVTALKREQMRLEEAKKKIAENSKDVPMKQTTRELAQHQATIVEKLGMTSEELLNEYVKIIKQDKDLSTKLKALTAPLKEEGINIQPDTSNQIIVPTLQIKVREIQPVNRLDSYTTDNTKDSHTTDDNIVDE